MNTRIGFILTTLISVAVLAPQASASLNDQYPTDADGNVEVPALTALSTAIVGAPTPAYCAPTSDFAYGWTFFTDSSEDGGVTWSTLVEPDIYISGEVCSELARLADYSQNRRFFRKAHASFNDHIYNAGAALLTLVHESLHVKLVQEDEGIVECDAIHNIWPTLAALHLPNWLNAQLLDVTKIVHESMSDEYRTVC